MRHVENHVISEISEISEICATTREGGWELTPVRPPPHPPVFRMVVQISEISEISDISTSTMYERESVGAIDILEVMKKTGFGNAEMHKFP